MSSAEFPEIDDALTAFIRTDPDVQTDAIRVRDLCLVRRPDDDAADLRGILSNMQTTLAAQRGNENETAIEDRLDRFTTYIVALMSIPGGRNDRQGLEALTSTVDAVEAYCKKFHTAFQRIASTLPGRKLAEKLTELGAGDPVVIDDFAQRFSLKKKGQRTAEEMVRPESAQDWRLLQNATGIESPEDAADGVIAVFGVLFTEMMRSSPMAPDSMAERVVNIVAKAAHLGKISNAPEPRMLAGFLAAILHYVRPEPDILEDVLRDIAREYADAWKERKDEEDEEKRNAVESTFLELLKSEMIVAEKRRQ